MARPEMICQGCGKSPLQLQEFRILCMEEKGMTPTNEQILETAWQEEGTLNRVNGHFLCTRCYIKEGSPSSPTGWICP